MIFQLHDITVDTDLDPLPEVMSVWFPTDFYTRETRGAGKRASDTTCDNSFKVTVKKKGATASRRLTRREQVLCSRHCDKHLTMTSLVPTTSQGGRDH